MNSAVFDGRPVLGKTQDEESHVVFLSPTKAEAEAPGTSLQLHWVTAGALEGKECMQNEFSWSALFTV